MKPVKYAIFIEPDGALHDFILISKERVRKWRSGQRFCDHPPHCTLIFGAYGSPEDWFDSLASVVRRLTFSLQVSRWCVFADDAFAGGGQTIALAVERSAELSALQMEIACLLGPYQVSCVNSVLCDDHLVRSQLKYGFAFVGTHWKPHFSVASLSVPYTDSFIADITKENVCFTQRVQHVALWRVEGDSHTRIAGFPFESIL